MTNPYHRFLLKHRPYCEVNTVCRPFDLRLAVEVIQFNGRDSTACQKCVDDQHPIETGMKRQSEAWR